MADLNEIQKAVQVNYDRLASSHSRQLYISMVLPLLLDTNITSGNNPASAGVGLQSWPKSAKSDMVILTDGTLGPRDFTNLLWNSRSPANVFNTFNNAQISNLTPAVSFYLKNPNNLKNPITPIPLQNIHNKITAVGNSILSTAQYGNFGLKDITMRLSGESPQEAKLDIATTVTFFGNSLSVFDDKSPYLYLIEPSYKNESIDRSLILQLGWNELSAASIKSLGYTKDQINAIKGQFLTLHCDYSYHSFNFKEDGSFVLTVQYTSYMERTIKDLSFMELSPKVLDQIYSTSAPATSSDLTPAQQKLISDHIRLNHRVPKSRQKKIYKYFVNKANGASPGLAKDLNKNNSKTKRLEAAISQIKDTLRNQSSVRLKDIILYLKDKDSQFTFYSTTKYMREVRLIAAANRVLRARNINPLDSVPAGGGVWRDVIHNNLREKYSLAEARTTSTAEIRNHSTIKLNAAPAGDLPQPHPATELNRDDPDSAGADFVYYRLGDLLSAFLDSGEGDQQLAAVLKEERMKFILGNIEVPVYSITTHSKPNKLMSLYDVPIEHDEFIIMIQKSFIGTTKTHINAQVFIQNLFKIVKKYYLTSNAALDPGKVNNWGLRSNHITIDKDWTGKTLSSSLFKKLSLGDRRFLPHKEGKNNLYSYIVYNASDHEISPKIEDLDEYIIGSPNSIVKRVSFQEAQGDMKQAYADENIQNSHMNDSATILPQMYDVKIVTLGNVRFFPMYTFVLYPFIGGVPLNKAKKLHETLGLSGVYITQEVEHRLSETGFTTSITKALNVTAAQHDRLHRKGKKNKAKPKKAAP